MWAVELWAIRMRDKPAPGNRHSADLGHVRPHLLLPANEVHRARERRQHYKLSESKICLFRHIRRRRERFQSITGESKDERSKHMDTVLPKCAKAVYKGIAG